MSATTNRLFSASSPKQAALHSSNGARVRRNERSSSQAQTTLASRQRL
jgi:hypothetical protein